ncbi:hypothetical protein F5Y16DRAFT_9252 [Xylariaceae sp. FL0255]|nr:hypothetical protein F5Y16DRAFT_9252 [Xylariaceae sp. FL0255]
MGDLIPIVLCTRPSSTVAIEAEAKRRSCLQPTPSTAALGHRRQQSLPTTRQAKRASLTVIPSRPNVPSSTSEWRKAIDSVKHKYVARKYRSCSIQCCEILDNLEDLSAVEPLHLIYLHFYAASSSEWCARPLSASSTYRTKLLRDAQAHYCEAETLLITAECWMAERSISALSTTRSNTPSLCGRSSESELSSAISSPRTSVFGPDEIVSPKPSIRSEARSRNMKKVSLSCLTELLEFQPEPYFRPDSPTLGWEDDIPMRRRKIESPSKSQRGIYADSMTNQQEFLRNNEGSGIAGIRPMIPSLLKQEHDEDKITSVEGGEAFDLGAFLQTRSISRFRARLSALRDQVSTHRNAVDSLLASREDLPPVPKVPLHCDAQSSLTIATSREISVPTVSSSPEDLEADPGVEETNVCREKPPRPSLKVHTNIGTLGSDRFARKALSATRLARSSSLSNLRHPQASISTVSAGAFCGEKLQDRIERLRAEGWPRRRFDCRRYEALREQVLGELHQVRIL